MNLIALKAGDVAAGMVVPWRVFSSENELLLSVGDRIESDSQIESLLACKPLRECVDGEGHRPVAEVRANDSFSFEEVDLHFGCPMQLEVSEHSKRQTHWARLLGYVPGQGLIVSHPQAGGFAVPMTQGMQVLVRVFSSQRAYKFSSWLQNICKVPFEYLYLAYPNEVVGVTVRSSPRVKVRNSVLVKRPGSEATGEPVGAWFCDLSETGAMIESREPLGAVDDTLDLSFELRLSDATTMLNLSAQIKTTHAIASGGTESEHAHRSGVRFTDVPEADHLKLRLFIYESMLYHPKARI